MLGLMKFKKLFWKKSDEELDKASADIDKRIAELEK